MDLPYISFFTPDRLAEFWHDVEVLAYLGMPMLLIFLATYFGGDLIRVLRGVFARRQDGDDYESEYDHD